jgi:EAL domain-containing protein (putative c-di-GMP-specific phosphodiesterase class I)
VEQGLRSADRSQCRLAHALGFSTTAEGMENQAQADVLGQLGCLELQGNLYGHPIPATKFTHDLKSRGA